MHNDSVVLESNAKPSTGCWTGSQGLIWQKIQEPLTQDNYALQVRVNVFALESGWRALDN